MTTKRRTFLKSAAASTFGFQFVPSTVWGANERVNLGCIGAGGKGRGEVKDNAKAGANIIALCDVDLRRAAETRKEFPKAKFYTDFREMLDKEKSLDAVTVSTPDHFHAIAAVTAMRQGKHCYCQKPLSHSIWEARLMTETAAKYKVVTQMGNQAHAGEPIRRAVELIRAGIIGKVKEVHAWTNRPIWPQGMKDPLPKQAVPEGLDWDTWLGPAQLRDFNEGYVPFKWRGWWDFGTGALGDMGCHIMDMPFWALDLKHPTSVEAEQMGSTLQAGPLSSTVTYKFPAGKYCDDLTFKWYDGTKNDDNMPPESVFEGTTVNRTQAKKFESILIGEKGKFLFNRQSTKWQTAPAELLADFEEPDKSIPRTPNEDAEWLKGITDGTPVLSGFEYSGPFTETVLLGNLAVRLGKKIDWDGVNLVAKNAPEAAALIKGEYRKGWELKAEA